MSFGFMKTGCMLGFLECKDARSVATMEDREVYDNDNFFKHKVVESTLDLLIFVLLDPNLILLDLRLILLDLEFDLCNLGLRLATIPSIGNVTFLRNRRMPRSRFGVIVAMLPMVFSFINSVTCVQDLKICDC